MSTATVTAPPGQGTPTPGAPVQTQTQPQASSSAASVTPAEPVKAPASATGAAPAAPAATPASGETKPPAVQPAASTTPADLKAADPGTPKAEVKYDLKLPEKTQLDAKAVESIAAFAKEKGLSPEQAQAVLEYQSRSIDLVQEAHVETARRIGSEGVEKLKGHAEFGGQNYVQTCEDVKRATDAVFPELRTLLGDSPIANAYELNLGLARLGKMMRAKPMVTDVRPAAEAPISDAEAFYGRKK